MPKCYGIIMSVSSGFHPTTNMWNLLGLIDNIQARTLPIIVPLEIHIFWYFAPEEIDRDFETRVAISINETRTEPSKHISFSSSTPYTHLRLREVSLASSGEYRAYIEWRPTGSIEWIREDIFWPFMVSLQSEESSST